MAPKFSIITCAYNTLPVVLKAYQSILPAVQSSDCELVIVDNQSPDENTREYIRCLDAENHLKVVLADPGKNLGCHGGWNYGFQQSHGQFVLKYDDDTVMTTGGWLEKMAQVLNDIHELAFLSADIDAKQANPYEMKTIKGHVLEVPKSGVVGFSCVMFRRDDILKWGLMKTGAYHAAGTRVFTGERLYGGEEVYYAEAALKENRFFAHYPSVFVHHLGNKERNPDYVFWKRAYGYHGWTDKPLDEWIKSGEHIKQYARVILQELQAPVPNDVLLVEWCRRVGEIGPYEYVYLMKEVIANNNNGVVKETCEKAIKQIEERVKHE